MVARTFPVYPSACVHRNLHPGRVDGGHTVCLDCGSPVIVAEALYASGKGVTEQREDLLRQLDEHEARHGGAVLPAVRSFMAALPADVVVTGTAPIERMIADGGWSRETEAALGRACCRYHAAKGTRPSCGNATAEELTPPKPCTCQNGPCDGECGYDPAAWARWEARKP